MTEVVVAILHPDAPEDAGPLTRATAAARADLAHRHARAFRLAGATHARIIDGPPDGRPFGARLREIAAGLGDGGLIVLGSGALALATRRDRLELVEVAASDRPSALTNNRYSGDIVAISRARQVLAGLPDLATDNELPRWLDEVARVPVDDRRRRTRLGVDIDGPLDLVLLGGRWPSHLEDAVTTRVRTAIADVRTVVRDPRAELVVAGRVSAANLGWLEARTASRTRALVEERGLRTRRTGQRPAASVLGALLDHDGPGALGAHLARLGDAAIIDTRVLLAHRFGADRRAWPPPEGRYASDLLTPAGVGDPWLRELTIAAETASIPILLGGHTLVGPGLPLVLGRRS